ncbi:hypothetical protein FE257_012757 [Aspergillus nanangensis]|uniref:non-specific serine/threonine protein kinase n=1 Tax=Aspergillus nanangensis TaxID=2582783 RepID=A0AAD4GQI7_ASPNN|nr:hypothetical protein FE257_012757 [Aspergillus nanangensis]
MAIQVTKTPSNIEADIIEALSRTRYACSTIKRLSGGYVNFTYRGTILCPLSDGSTSVIVKHGEEYSTELRGFSASTIRCEAEQSIIRRVNQIWLQNVIYDSLSIRIPRLYHFFPQSNTQIMEDITESKTLHGGLQFLSAPTAASIGQSLGAWIASFHSWARSHTDPSFSSVLGNNGELYEKQVRRMCINLSSECENKRVVEYYRDRLLEIDKEDVGVVHGDFTSRNVLVQNSHGRAKRPISLAIVDWEACHLGNQSRDIATFIGSLYMEHHFHGIEVARSMLQGFVQGYGPLREDLAFRVVVHTGMYFFLWKIYGDGKQTEKQVRELLQLAQDLLVKGCEKDREGITQSFLGCLLKP